MVSPRPCNGLFLLAVVCLFSYLFGLFVFLPLPPPPPPPPGQLEALRKVTGEAVVESGMEWVEAVAQAEKTESRYLSPEARAKMLKEDKARADELHKVPPPPLGS